MDGNTVVNSTDYAIMKRYLIGTLNEFSYTQGLQAADVNGDGAVDSLDAAFMKKLLLGKITKLPAQAQ